MTIFRCFSGMPQQKWGHQSPEDSKTCQGLREKIQLQTESPKNILESRNKI